MSKPGPTGYGPYVPRATAWPIFIFKGKKAPKKKVTDPLARKLMPPLPGGSLQSSLEKWRSSLK